MSLLSDILSANNVLKFKKYTLSDLAHYTNGKGHENDVSDDGNFVLITSKFIATNGKIKRMCDNRFSPIEAGEIAMVLSDLPNGKALAKCYLVEENNRYTVNQRICKLSPKTEVIIPKFLYYILNRHEDLLRFDSGVDQTNLSKSQVVNLELTIPPLEVQNEIVRVLDAFTELEIELEAEMEARTRQYEHYRDMLLDFSTGITGVNRIDKMLVELCPNGVTYDTLGNKTKILRGASPRPISRFITTDDKGVNWIKIGDTETGAKYLTKTEEKITFEGSLKSRTVYPGDFILSNSMSFGRPYISKIVGCIHDGWLSISEYENCFTTDFLYHLLSSSIIQGQFGKGANYGTVRNLNVEIVKNVIVPIIPLKVQHEIVKVLDYFSEYITSSSKGLPAEIEARKKQYEYYKNKLLTF
jgi:type I restriction enzyme S subunit